MAGGTWTEQNKVRPGVYIRFRSSANTGLTVGQRGVVAIGKLLDWGPVGQMTAVTPGTDTTPITGYTFGNNQFLIEIFKGTNRTGAPSKVLLYRLTGTGAAAATATVGNLTATANYVGTRGNSISIIVTDNEDDTFTVQTVVDGTEVDTQTVETVSGLSSNDWVKWSGTGALTATAGTALTGGSNGTAATMAYEAFLTALEPYQFDVLIYDGTEADVKAAMLDFVERIADENGTYAQLVAANLTSPDSRFAVNVTSGVTLGDGTALTAPQTTWWAGGALAGALYNESLTYAEYPGAVSVSPMLTNAQYVTALQSGQFVLFADNGAVKVEQDINSLVTYTEEIGKSFHKNRVVRLCSTIANDIYTQFSSQFIGTVNNNEEGRSRLKAAVVGYLLDIQAGGGIQNFSPEDVEVLPGNDIDAVLLNIGIQPIDAIEKIYMTIEVG